MAEKLIKTETKKEEVIPADQTENKDQLVKTDSKSKDEFEVKDNESDHSSHQSNVNADLAEDVKANAVIEDDKKVKEAVVNGDVFVDASTASLLQKPMVADYHTGQPKYETADQAMAALQISGKLVTPASKD